MTPRSDVFWLRFASAFTMAFGFLFAVAAVPGLSGPAAFFLDVLFRPMDGAQTANHSETRLLAAIGGGITVGWGYLMWLVSTHVLPTNPELARRLLMPPLMTWFITDSAFSILSGAPLNAAANVVFLLLFLVPLYRSGRSTPMQETA
jgi:hypothetical protein